MAFLATVGCTCVDCGGPIHEGERVETSPPYRPGDIAPARPAGWRHHTCPEPDQRKE